ncbi:MAG: hypothetical protein AAF405_10155 [Pseudomonadota bacterium]
MISHRLTLDYTLAPGWMAPFVEGLLEGIAMARRCVACGRKSFVPVRICQCGEFGAEWVQLDGTAEILFRTEGADGAFGLVAFAGAETNAVARLMGIPEGESRGQLVAAEGPLPALTLGPRAAP